MATYVMFIGPPASGKSTARERMLKIEPEMANAVVLSTDEHIESVALANGKTYEQVFGAEVKVARRLMDQQFVMAINSNKNILHDQTNMTKASRRGKLERLPKSYKKIAICVIPETGMTDTQKDALKQRLQTRKEKSPIAKDIPWKVVSSMIDSFEAPGADEGFDEIYYEVSL